MSSLTRPRGPLPARVYWARRVIVVGLAMLLFVGVGRFLSGGSDGESAQPTARQAGAEITSSTSPVAPTTTEATKQPKKRKTKDPLAEPDGPCDPADVEVRGEVREAKAGDRRVPVRLSFRGTEPACTFRVSNDSVVVKISSGDDLIWTTQQCEVIPTEDIVVRSEVVSRVTLTWHGRRSDDECTPAARFALPGYYHLVAATLGGEPVDRQFQVGSPRTVRVTRTVQPDPKQDDEKNERKRERDEAEPTEEPVDRQSDGADEPSR